MPAEGLQSNERFSDFFFVDGGVNFLVKAFWLLQQKNLRLEIAVVCERNFIAAEGQQGGSVFAGLPPQ